MTDRKIVLSPSGAAAPRSMLTALQEARKYVPPCQDGKVNLLMSEAGILNGLEKQYSHYKVVYDPAGKTPESRFAVLETPAQIAAGEPLAEPSLGSNKRHFDKLRILIFKMDVLLERLHAPEVLWFVRANAEDFYIKSLPQ